jgi:hypothetical protein
LAPYLPLLQIVQIDKGKFYLDHLRLDAMTPSELRADFQLRDGRFTVENGAVRCGGAIDFRGAGDFTVSPPSGILEFSAAKLSLPEIFGDAAEALGILSGAVSFPAPDAANKFLRLEWRGLTAPEIWATLTGADLTWQIENLTARAQKPKINWQEILETDFHPSIAAEIARQFKEREARHPETTTLMKIKRTRGNASVNHREVIIDQCVIIGESVADMLAKGKIYFDRRLQIRIWLTDNVDRHFDIEALFNYGRVKDLLATLPKDKQATARVLVPHWLNNLAQSQQLFFDVAGTLDAPEIIWRDLHQNIKDNLPQLITEAVKLASSSEILRNIFGDLKLGENQNGPLIDLDQLLK